MRYEEIPKDAKKYDEMQWDTKRYKGIRKDTRDTKRYEGVRKDTRGYEKLRKGYGSRGLKPPSPPLLPDIQQPVQSKVQPIKVDFTIKIQS